MYIYINGACEYEFILCLFDATNEVNWIKREERNLPNVTIWRVGYLPVTEGHLPFVMGRHPTRCGGLSALSYPLLRVVNQPIAKDRQSTYPLLEGCSIVLLRASVK
jgi:hypothetical protein